MKEVKEWLYSTITGDTTFQSLTGATSTDKKMYEISPPEKVELPYVVYQMSSGPVLPETVIVEHPMEFYTLHIFATSSLVAENIFNRIVDLVHNQTNVELTNWKFLRATIGSQNDLVEIDSKSRRRIFHKTMMVQVSSILKK